MTGIHKEREWKPIEKGTIGKTPASKLLEIVINENKLEYRRITRVISSFSMLLHDIKDVKAVTRQKIAQNFYNQIRTTPLNIHPKVDTLVVNICKARLMEWLEENDTRKQWKTQKIED